MTATTPEAETHVICGMTFEVSTRTEEGMFHNEVEILCIRGEARDFLRLPENTVFPGVTSAWGTYKFEALHEGVVIRTESNLYYLQRAIRTYFRDQEVDRYREISKKLSKQRSALRQRDRSVKLLGELLSKMDKAIDEIFWKGKAPSSVEASLRAVERELKRVQEEPTFVLVRDIVEGRLWHRDHNSNTAVLERLESLEVRTKGAVEAVSMDWLAEYYLMALEGVNSVGQAGAISLGVSLDDFVSKETLEDPELVALMAPETLEFTGRKGAQQYTVEYGYGEIDGKRVPMGHLTMPLSVYERQSELPKLPHHIQLVVSLTVEDKVVIVGQARVTLETKVKKYRKARSRSGTFPSTDEYGFRRRAAVIGDTPPPWYTGKVR